MLELGVATALFRLRFFITSVFKLSGRTTPCNFKNKPQALHSGCPSGFRRQRGVVVVAQFEHFVTPLLTLFLLDDDEDSLDLLSSRLLSGDDERSVVLLELLPYGLSENEIVQIN